MYRSLSLFLLLSCSGQAIRPINQKPILEKLEVKSFEVFNGKVKFLNFETQLKDGLYQMQCQSRPKSDYKVKFQVVAGRVEIYYAEDYYSEAGQKKCVLADGREFININVKEFPYQEEKLRVSRKKVVLSPAAQKRVENEWLATQEVYKHSENKLLFSAPFRKPLYSKITSNFGKRRVFNKMKKTSHLGTDFRAAVGVKVPVANSGRVVFTGDLFYTGNVVIVDHGMDIFTLYAHLSEISVKVGQTLQKGQIVGLAGKTGRVSGPHLHWGVKMAGRSVDGFTLVEASQEQFGL